MSRLEPIPPTQLDEAQRALYVSITDGPRAQGPQHFALTRPDGALLGPFNALLLSPGLGQALQEVGAAVRYRTGLSVRTREIAILTVATHWSSTFEREAHESIGAAIGLTDEEMGRIRTGEVPELEDDPSPYRRWHHPGLPVRPTPYPHPPRRARGRSAPHPFGPVVSVREDHDAVEADEADQVIDSARAAEHAIQRLCRTSLSRPSMTPA